MAVSKLSDQHADITKHFGNITDSVAKKPLSNLLWQNQCRIALISKCEYAVVHHSSPLEMT